VEGRDDLVVSDLVITEVASALSRRLRQARSRTSAYAACSTTTWARATSLASFDGRLRAAARAVGLAIYPPEEMQ
jgi:hypothetical protein